MRAVEPSASPQLVAIDCAAFCGALAWPSRPIEYFGKTKRQIEKDIVRSRGARNARLGYKSQSAKGLGGTLQLIGLIGAFGWLIWFLGGMLTHLAKMAGLPIPALCQFIYYDWADSNTLFVAALFCLPFLTFIPLVGLGLKLSGAHARDVLANDPRPPILLLRSFGDEKQAPIDKTSFGKVTALESSLGLALAGLGPFVAVGQPGEKIEYRGAARAYYAVDEWGSAVIDFMEKAYAIILVAGRGEGLVWEIEQLSMRGNFDKTVIVLPPEDSAAARLDRWEMLRRFLPRLSDARPGASDSVVAIYQTRKATVLLWSSRRLRAADYQQVLRLAFYHLGCERQL